MILRGNNNNFLGSSLGRIRLYKWSGEHDHDLVTSFQIIESCIFTLISIFLENSSVFINFNG